MSYSNHYLESRVLEASPLELVRLTYRGALDATSLARQHFMAGNIPARTQALNRATALVSELVISLRVVPDAGVQPIEQNLRRLYDYVLHQFAQAAIEQSASPLQNADAVLRSLLEAWEAIDPEPPALPPRLDSADNVFSVSA